MSSSITFPRIHLSSVSILVFCFVFFWGPGGGQRRINESKDDCPENTLTAVLLLFLNVLLSTIGSCYSSQQQQKYSFDTVLKSDFFNVLMVCSRMERKARGIFVCLPILMSFYKKRLCLHWVLPVFSGENTQNLVSDTTEDTFQHIISAVHFFFF